MNPRLRKILLWTFVGLLALGQFQRIELGGSFTGINVYFHDIFIFIWLVGFVLTEKINLKFSKTSLKKIVSSFKIESIFIGISITGIALNVLINNDWVSLLYVLRFGSYILFFLSLRYLVTKKQIRASDIRFKFFGAGAIILFLGFLQLILIKDTRFLAILGWDDHFNRLISTIFDPGFTGLIFVITLMFFYSLSKIDHNFKIFEGKLINSIISLWFLVGIALTFSRASYLALFVALLSLGVLNRKVIATSIFKIVFFVFIILLIPKPGGEGVDLSRTSTITARRSAIAYQLDSVTPKTLLIGNGLFSKQNRLAQNGLAQNRLETNEFIPSHSRMPDNFLVNLLLSTGQIGTAIAIFIIFKWVIKISKQDPELGSAIIATLVHAQFSNSIFQPFILLMLLGGIASLKSKA